MSSLTLAEFIERVSDGSIFSVTFIKRTTGEERTMVCRRGVKKHLRGGELPYDPKEKKLLTAYDVQKEGYRVISLDSLVSLRYGGNRYVWEENKFVPVL